MKATLEWCWVTMCTHECTRIGYHVTNNTLVEVDHGRRDSRDTRKGNLLNQAMEPRPTRQQSTQQGTSNTPHVSSMLKLQIHQTPQEHSRCVASGATSRV